MRSKVVLFMALYAVLPVFGQSRPSVEQLKKQAIQAVDARQDFVQQMVDQVFSYSELGFQEHETSRYVTGILEKNGFKVEQGIAGIPTAWVAQLRDRQARDRVYQRPGLHPASIAKARSGVSRSYY